MKYISLGFNCNVALKKSLW